MVILPVAGGCRRVNEEVWGWFVGPAMGLLVTSQLLPISPTAAEHCVAAERNLLKAPAINLSFKLTY